MKNLKEFWFFSLKKTVYSITSLRLKNKNPAYNKKNTETSVLSGNSGKDRALYVRKRFSTKLPQAVEGVCVFDEIHRHFIIITANRSWPAPFSCFVSYAPPTGSERCALKIIIIVINVYTNGSERWSRHDRDFRRRPRAANRIVFLRQRETF